MSDRDELIAKARKVTAGATPGPWTWANWGETGEPDTTLQAERPANERERTIWGPIKQIALVRNDENDLSPGDRAFLADSRTLLPALADLAESEGRRADQLHRDIVHCREVECGHYIAERDMARDEVKRLDAALVKSAEYIAKVEAARDAALAELAALKGQQP